MRSPRTAPLPHGAPLPDWIEAILAEDDEPLPKLSPARRAALDAVPSDRKRLTVVVALYGPNSTRDAIRLAAPGADRARTAAMAGSLANLAREGRIDRLDRGLYDAIGNATRHGRRRAPAEPTRAPRQSRPRS